MRKRPETEEPSIGSAPTLGEGAAALLKQVATWVRGHAYHAYWLTGDGAEFQLMASLSRSVRTAVRPDYAGLVSQVGPVIPLVPLVVARNLAPGRPQVRGDGRLCWLDLPFGAELLVTIPLVQPVYVSQHWLARLGANTRACAADVAALHHRFRAGTTAVAE